MSFDLEWVNTFFKALLILVRSLLSDLILAALSSFCLNSNIVLFLIALHAISGCDTVPALFNIGKGKAPKAVEKVPLKKLGKIDSSIESVIKEGKQFVAKCYGQQHESSSHNRKSIWISKRQMAQRSLLNHLYLKAYHRPMKHSS